MSAVTFWLVVSLIGLALTVYAEREAYRDSEAVKILNGSIIGINARGSLFQERLRAVIQIVFVAAGLMALTNTAEHLIVPFLLTTPVLLAVNSLRGLIDRRKVIHKGHAEITAERDRRMDRLEDQGAQLSADIAENTRITQGVRDDARVAATVASSVSDKIADQGDVLIAQGEVQAEASALGADTNATAHRIDKRIP